MGLSRGYLQLYILSVLLFAILSIVNDVLLVTGNEITLLGVIVAITTLIFFLFNLVTFALFVKWQAPRILLTLPVYIVSITLLFIIAGVTLGVLNLLTAKIVLGITIASIFSSVFELGFSAYLISSFDPEKFE
ncbi:hypothetical protein HYV86_06875 [Candidatus Woesearchaeota archaeon]|nr:hypothetical protein [Candidatus Woesearchaeota archaeon]